MTSTLADLQRRNLEKMNPSAAEQPPVEPPPALTEARTYGSTDYLTEGRTDASEDGSTEARQQVSAEGSKPVRKASRKEARTEVSRPISAAIPKAVSTDGLMATVEAALASREPLIGGVKATVDMSPDLSTRAKRYLADHRGQNTRQVLIALFDAFLTAKGY